MKAGDIYKPTLILYDAAGAVVTGGAAGFTVTSYVNGVLTALTATVTEITAGKYFLSVTLPATLGTITVFLTHSTSFPSPNKFDGVNTTNDEDSITAKLAIPASYLVATTGLLGAETRLTLDAYREQTISITVVDSAGAPVPGTGYTNLRLTVRDKLHANSTNVAITTGVTWDSAGLLTVPIPEASTFFAAIDTDIAAGRDSTDLRYDIIGDRAGVAGQTRTIMRGTLTLRRFEGPA